MSENKLRGSFPHVAQEVWVGILSFFYGECYERKRTPQRN